AGMSLLKLLSRLPLRVLYAITDALYVLVYHVWGFRRSLTQANLENSFPEKSPPEISRIARQSYHNAFDLVAEVIKGADMPADELRRRMRINNLDILAPYLAANKPVVLLASHHCNWEWLLLAACIELKVSVDAVYKPLRVAGIDSFMFELRSRFGGHPIAVKDFLVEVLKRRDSARIIALVADQTPPREEEKHWTRFLHQDTAFFVGADKIARITRSPVFFVGIARTRRGHYEATLQMLAQPPYASEGSDIIERYARVAELHITQHPADWLWMYRKWKYKKPLYA
ncbi:MAG: lysophospholipid acyltransferase family protein, partial [Burkholderiales bacterium]